MALDNSLNYEGLRLVGRIEKGYEGFAFGEPIRTMLKIGNSIERCIQEIERRTIPMRAFNNTKSAERIIYGIIAYILNQQQDMPNDEFTQSA